MNLYRKIDNNGLFIEDELLETIPIILDNETTGIPHAGYIETLCPEGLYLPKWDFKARMWVEGGSRTPEPPELEIKKLKTEIASTDYKIIKCYEYQLVGLNLPYDLEILHSERQVLRDRINELENWLNSQ